MSIQEHLNKIRNAKKGIEVRESIAKGIETAYDDAIEKDNANMEVKMARGTNPNLNTRLNKMEETDQEVTAQLAQTDGRVDNLVLEYDIDPNKDPEVIDARGGEATVGDNIDSVKKVFNYTMENEIDRVIWSHPSVPDVDIVSTTGGYVTAILKGVARTGRLRQTYFFSPQKKYFVSLRAQVDSPASYLRLETSGGISKIIEQTENPSVNQEYYLSGVLEGSNSTSIFIQTEYSSPEEAEGTQLKIREIFVWDLSKTFGLGNEPEDEDEIRKFLEPYPRNYLEGIKHLSLDKLAYEIATSIDSSDVVPPLESGYYSPINRIPAYDGSEGFDSETMTASDIHGLWDDLMSRFEESITKTTLGKDQSGLYDLVQYDIKLGNPKYKMILLTNTHGNGSQGDPNDSSIGIYEFIKDMLENHDKSVPLSNVRHNVHFIIIPCVNPWGVDNKTRQNSRGVDINRNFDYNWQQGTDPSHTYGGEYPFSEAESRIVRGVMDANLDADGLIDVHVFGRGTTDFSYPALTTFIDNYASKVAFEVSDYLANKYDTRANIYTSPLERQHGMIKTYSEMVKRIMSLTTEFPAYASDKVTHGTEMMTKITEWFGAIICNWVDNLGSVKESESTGLDNFVRNGNFAKQTDGWTGIDDILNGVARKKNTVPYASISQSFPRTERIGDVLYVTSLVKADSSNVSLSFREKNSGTDVRVNHTGSGTFERFSFTHENSEMATEFTIQFRDSRDSDWSDYYVKKVVAINLTKAFGKGNEPSVEQMDKLVELLPDNYWSGKLKLTQQEMMNWLVGLIIS